MRRNFPYYDHLFHAWICSVLTFHKKIPWAHAVPTIRGFWDEDSKKAEPVLLKNIKTTRSLKRQSDKHYHIVSFSPTYPFSSFECWASSYSEMKKKLKLYLPGRMCQSSTSRGEMAAEWPICLRSENSVVSFANWSNTETSSCVKGLLPGRLAFTPLLFHCVT